MEFWGQKTFCVIAGASRGIGQAVAIAFSQKVGPGSVFLLLARTTSALEETKSKILQGNTTTTVITQSIDLSRPDQPSFKGAISKAFQESGTSPLEFQHCILVQCAASLGIDRGFKVAQIQDTEYIRNYYDFNLTSFILLNSVFCEVVKADKDPTQRRTTIIHISSHGAVEPFKTWGLYCAARAAKDMLLKSIALESPHVHTINYAPGVVDTENYREALRDTADKELVKLFEEEKDKGRLLQPEQTAEKLVEILGMGKYKNGEHVSYSDH